MSTPSIHETIEQAVQELMRVYDVQEPPVMIELMLRRPVANMWDELNFAELSSSFIDMSDRFAPRMALARLFARHLFRSAWGKKYGFDQYITDDRLVRYFARAVTLPAPMVAKIILHKNSGPVISARFEIPEADVLLRLADLGLSLGE
jgi:hypothetical protein